MNHRGQRFGFEPYRWFIYKLFEYTKKYRECSHLKHYSMSVENNKQFKIYFLSKLFLLIKKKTTNKGKATITDITKIPVQNIEPSQKSLIVVLLSSRQSMTRERPEVEN